MKREEISREDKLEKICIDIGIKIYNLSIVSDDWLNKLKVYKKIEVDEDTIYGLWVITYCALLELLLARVGDLITKEEMKKMEIILIDSFGTLLESHNLERKPGGVTNVKNIIYQILEKERRKRIKNDLSIVEGYKELIKSEKKNLSKYFWEYLASKLESFEDSNFRSRLESM